MAERGGLGYLPLCLAGYYFAFHVQRARCHPQARPSNGRLLHGGGGLKHEYLDPTGCSDRMITLFFSASSSAVPLTEHCPSQSPCAHGSVEWRRHEISGGVSDLFRDDDND